ncbi:MAG: leucine-rich repeat domain-containing protein [Oscillospiraceae bacterium]|jgi:hypothetical protein|nr:leucine-rich repeat domain-containing protein [Oscillospiraceae bacterium]
MKKIIAMIITVALMTVNPFGITAADNDGTVHKSGAWWYLIKADGTAEIFKYDFRYDMENDDYLEHVVIPSEVDGYTVTSLESGPYIGELFVFGSPGVFYLNSFLETVTIPDTVTNIGNNTFLDCTGLTDITIPDSVTSIGDNAFATCANLTSVSIPDSVTYLGEGVFTNCIRLNDITLPNSITSIPTAAFYKCEVLTSAPIPDSVKIIDIGAFNSCRRLPELEIPDSVETIGVGAFAGCNLITSVTVPDSVTFIAPRAFGYTFDEYQGEGYYSKIEKFKIYGSMNSAAEAYASENEFRFVYSDSEITAIKNEIHGIEQLSVRRAEIVDRNGDAVINVFDLTVSKQRVAGKTSANNIASVYISNSGGPIMESEFKIDFENKQLWIWGPSPSDTPWEPQRRDPTAENEGYTFGGDLSDEKIAEFRRLANKYGFTSWNDEYVDPLTAGGHMWTMEITYIDGSVKETYGINEYPDTWENMLDAFLVLTGYDVAGWLSIPPVIMSN